MWNLLHYKIVKDSSTGRQKHFSLSKNIYSNVFIPLAVRGNAILKSVDLIQTVKSIFSLPKYLYSVFLFLSVLVLLIGLIYMSKLSPNHQAKVVDERVEIKIDAKKLITELKIGRKTKYYEVNKYPDSEMVSGKKGDYFVVDIKDASTTEILHFEAGKYTIDNLDKKFRESLTRFYKDIWQGLANEGKAEIFIRGPSYLIGMQSR